MAKIEVCEHGVLKTIRCSQCEAKAQTDAETARRSHMAQQRLQIVLKNGQGVVELPIPDPANFNLVAFCKMVRADDGVWTDNVHVPWSNILLIGMGNVQIQKPNTKQTMN